MGQALRRHAGLQSGAIAIIRLSGDGAFATALKVFRPSSAALQAPTWAPQSHRIYHGHAVDEQGAHIDEVGVKPCALPHMVLAQLHWMLM